MDELHDQAWFEDYFGPDYLKIDFQPNTGREVAFMQDVLELEAGSRFLDAACGYGRHAIPLAESGVDVVGCDLSAFMLKKAQDGVHASSIAENGGSISFARCDLRELPFECEFDAASIMFNSFGYFQREDENFRVLASIADSLKPGGLFLLDLVNRDFLLRTPHEKDWFERNGTVILEEKHFDAVRNRSEIDVHVVDGGKKRSYHHSIRLYSLSELSMLLEASGLAVENVYGGFESELFDWNKDRMLIVSRRMDD